MKRGILILMALVAAAAIITTGVHWIHPSNQEDFQWAPFDKAYFAFVLDDTNEYTAPMYQLFHEKGVPLSAAAITGMLGTPAVGMDGTITDVLHLITADGGEVLAHYSGNLADRGYSDGEHTFETGETVWNERTAGTKAILEGLGFTVRGVIRADYSQEGSRMGEKICRRYFDYSDGLGQSKQYALKRNFMMSYSTVEDFLQWIDACCLEPGFYPICFHGWESIASTEDVSRILDHILVNHAEDAAITTYAYVYDRFGQILQR